MRLIDADYASDAVGFDEFTETLDMMPTVDAKPVVHAHWIDNGRDKSFTCSNCKSGCLLNYEADYHKSDYCPHCGAKMDEVVSRDEQ